MAQVGRPVDFVTVDPLLWQETEDSLVKTGTLGDAMTDRVLWEAVDVAAGRNMDREKKFIARKYLIYWELFPVPSKMEKVQYNQPGGWLAPQVNDALSQGRYWSLFDALSSQQ